MTGGLVNGLTLIYLINVPRRDTTNVGGGSPSNLTTNPALHKTKCDTKFDTHASQSPFERCVLQQNNNNNNNNQAHKAAHEIT